MHAYRFPEHLVRQTTVSRSPAGLFSPPLPSPPLSVSPLIAYAPPCAECAELGSNRPPSGSTISDVVPSGTFRCADGRYVVIGGNGDSVYSRLMVAVGQPGMTAENERFATNAARCKEVDYIMGEG